MTDELFFDHLDEYNKLIEITQRLVDHDLPFINQLMDEIRDYQPFLGSCMLGYAVDFKGAEADAFFKIMNRNIFFFKYLEKEEGTPAFRDAVAEDLRKNNHGILIAFINLCFKQWPALENMNSQEKGFVTIGLKSFVECFEEIRLKN